jgi:WD40 repeat protein
MLLNNQRYLVERAQIVLLFPTGDCKNITLEKLTANWLASRVKNYLVLDEGIVCEDNIFTNHDKKHTGSLLAQSNLFAPITVDNASNVVRIATVGDSRIDDVAWSPDGTLLATLGPSGLRLYDTENLETTPQLFVFEPDPRCESYQEYRRSTIQFSSDGANIINVRVVALDRERG